MRFAWNCQGHETFKPGCEECEQITREMQPEHCVFAMSQKESPHHFVDGRCRCSMTEGYLKKLQSEEDSNAKG